MHLEKTCQLEDTILPEHVQSPDDRRLWQSQPSDYLSQRTQNERGEPSLLFVHAQYKTFFWLIYTAYFTLTAINHTIFPNSGTSIEGLHQLNRVPGAEAHVRRTHLLAVHLEQEDCTEIAQQSRDLMEGIKVDAAASAQCVQWDESLEAEAKRRSCDIKFQYRSNYVMEFTHMIYTKSFSPYKVLHISILCTVLHLTGP